MKSMLVSPVKSLYIKMPILKTILIYCIFTLSDVRTGNLTCFYSSVDERYSTENFRWESAPKVARRNDTKTP